MADPRLEKSTPMPLQVSVPTPVVRMKAPVINVPEIKVPPPAPVDITPVADTVARLEAKIDALTAAVNAQTEALKNLKTAAAPKAKAQRATSYEVETEDEDGNVRRMRISPRRSN